MKTIAGLFAASALLSVATPVSAAGPNASDYNLFVTGNMTAQYNDTEGAVAVGGNATLNGYSVSALPRGGRSDLVVGGKLDASGGSTGGTIAVGGDAKFRSYGVGNGLPGGNTNLQVGGKLDFDNGSINGKYSVGGTVTAPSYITSGNPPVVAPAVLPLDIAAEGLRLRTLSTALGARANTGTVGSVTGGDGRFQLTLAGTNAGLNIFSLTSAQMTNWSDFSLNIPVGATALVNISGTANAVIGGGFHYSGGANYSSVLFNFYQSTALGFGDIDMSGSVLAPLATYTPGGVPGDMTWGGGVINGQVFVANWTATDYRQTQVNSRYFSGDLLDPPTTTLIPPSTGGAVPEPASWALMILGFGLVGATTRRRQRVFAAA